MAQATAELTFDDTLNQFGNGTIGGQSRHNAYCPIINQYFVQNAQTVAQATAAFLKAYYKCSLSGGHCAVSLGLATYNRCNPKSLCNTLYTAHQINGNFPAFALLNVLAEELAPGIVGCAGGKNITVVDKCITPDPVPGP